MAVELRTLHPAQPALRGLLILFLVAGAAMAQESEHIFEPGKKHVCVPAANGEGWDCGTAEQPPAASTPHREGPAIRASHANDPASASIADAADAEPSAARPNESREDKPQSRAVPNYLLAAPSSNYANEAAQSAPTKTTREATPASGDASSHADAKPATVSPPAPASPSTTSGSVAETPPKAAPAPSATAAQDRTAQDAANGADRTKIQSTEIPDSTATIPAAIAPDPAPPQPAATSATASPAHESSATLANEQEQRTAFSALRGSGYVLELARGTDRGRVAAAALINLPQGQVWLLRISRDGNDWYVALWGEFPTVEAARDARNVAAGQGLTEVGWPRRIGPLQQELRLQR